MDKRDVVDAPQNLLDIGQAGTAPRQIALGGVSGDDELGIETQARQEHLHLLAGGVLGLVQDHEGIVERAAAHVGERRDLDHPALDKSRGLLGIHHVHERIEKRADVRVDLVLKRAGKESQVLPRLDHGTREHDAPDVVTVQGGDRHGHGQVGLSRTGGPQAKGQRMRANGLHIALLTDGLGAHGAAAIAKQHLR